MSVIEPVVSVVAEEVVEVVGGEVAKGFFSSAVSAVARNPVVAVGVVAGTTAVLVGGVFLKKHFANKKQAASDKAAKASGEAMSEAAKAATDAEPVAA